MSSSTDTNEASASSGTPPQSTLSDLTSCESDAPITFREISPAIEFMFWVVLALTPMLHLVNGPPVTSDQAVVQVSLVIIAAVGALGLRVFNWLVKPPPS